jgi:hypothetical protein
LARFTKSSDESDKPWPYGEKLAEGKIHTKVIDYADIAIAQIKTPPVAEVTAENKQKAVAKAKKPAAKKQQFDKKPAVVKAATKKGTHEGNKAPTKRAPAKKKST